MPRASLEYQREINPGGGIRRGWPRDARPARWKAAVETDLPHACQVPNTENIGTVAPAEIPAGPQHYRGHSPALSPLAQSLHGELGEHHLHLSSCPGRGLRVWRVPEHPARSGLGSSGQGAPRAGHPADGAHLPQPRRGARAGRGSGQGPGPSGERAVSRPQRPFSGQGAAERREGAAQAAGAAGHGAAAQAVALQAPRQPVPHQDGEDSAGPRLPDDPGAGKEGNPLPPPPTGALRRFMDGRDGDGICRSSSVSPAKDTARCREHQCSQQDKGSCPHPSSTLPWAPPPQQGCLKQKLPHLSYRGWRSAKDNQQKVCACPPRNGCPHPFISFINIMKIFLHSL